MNIFLIEIAIFFCKSKFYGDHNHYYEKIGNNVVDITNKIPFEIPDSWCFARVQNVCQTYTGNSINAEEKQKKYTNLSDGYNYIGTKDVEFDRTICYENGIKIPFDTDFRIAHKGSTLMCIEGGSAGRKLGILNQDVCFGNKLCAFEPYDINSKFIYYYLQSPTFIDSFQTELSGIIGGVSADKLKRLIVVLPPLAEQQRIVEKIESLFAEIDKIEKAQNELDKLKEQTRQKVLDLAVRGKLVKQDPNDEPASILLEKIEKEKKQLIKEGKIKKDKNESIIYRGDDKNYYEKIGNKVTNITDEIPFEIPESWCFVRQGVICWLDNGVKSSDENLPYLEAKTLRGAKDPEMVSTGVLVHESDKVILVDGENSGEVMNVPCEGYMGSTFRILKTTNFISYDYLSLFFELNKSLYRNNKKGTAIPHLNKEIFRSLLFPLPPFNEQERIASMAKQIDMIM